MIYRIFASKDTVITNDLRLGVRMTASNLGGSEELQVFKSPGISGTIGTIGSSSLGRSLLFFDFSKYSALTASGDIPITGSRYRLRVAHKTSASPLPSSFDILVSPISASWDEGNGMDVDDLADVGYANWIQPQQSTYWTTPGGDVLSEHSATIHFDTGYEDGDVDVTGLVNAWLTGGLQNNGLMMAMDPSIESDSNYGDYFIKKFYSRQTGYSDRVPFIEVSVPDFVQDDRANMFWGQPGSLFLYNTVRGQFVDLTAPVTVAVADLSGVLVQATASRVSLGIYSASLVLQTGSYSGSIFYDAWASAGSSLVTSSFEFVPAQTMTSLSPVPLTARIRNLETEYSTDDTVKLDVFFRKRSRVMPVITTASLGVPPYIVSKGYYAIENDSTRERVVQFGTGSDETRLSYDGQGNYFKFYMSVLQPGNVYRILFLVDEFGVQQVVDPGLRFKVS